MNAAQVAEFERIPLDSVYRLSTINFLNNLAYLKDKAREDKRLQDEWLRKHKNS